MDLLFGDATTAMPTPATQGERGSLTGAGSPVPSLDIRRHYGQFGAESAIPGLEIDPPNMSNDDGPLHPRDDKGDRSERIGGWISNMVSWQRGPPKRMHGQYRRLGQEEDREH